MELITLTSRELIRVQFAQRVVDGALRLPEAAQALGISTRQVKRLTRRLRERGASAFASPQRDRAPNKAFDVALRERVLELARTVYVGFGPTFMAEKLAQRDQIHLNRETLRLWLIEPRLHRPRKRRQKARPLRERRPRFGELVQADGSPHRWFEERGKPCTLLLCVDDATSTILGGLFAEAESTNAYFELFETVFTCYGLPLALYTDKHGIFRINHQGSTIDEETPVQRALRECDIELICANSPQAKGRVERANRSLQDRLVKELRLACVNTVASANQFLTPFLVDFNARFSVQPQESSNAHRRSDPETLARILTKRFERVLTNNLTFQLDDYIYAIDQSPHYRVWTGMRVCVNVPRNEKQSSFSMNSGSSHA